MSKTSPNSFWLPWTKRGWDAALAWSTLAAMICSLLSLFWDDRFLYLLFAIFAVSTVAMVVTQIRFMRDMRQYKRRGDALFLAEMIHMGELKIEALPPETQEDVRIVLAEMRLGRKEPS